MPRQGGRRVALERHPTGVGNRSTTALQTLERDGGEEEAEPPSDPPGGGAGDDGEAQEQRHHPWRRWRRRGHELGLAGGDHRGGEPRIASMERKSSSRGSRGWPARNQSLPAVVGEAGGSGGNKEIGAERDRERSRERERELTERERKRE